jgi:hypothetical protein
MVVHPGKSVGRINMRNKRQLVGGFVLAAMMSVAMPLSAAHNGDSAIGGPKRSACAFLEGILMKMSAPEKLALVFERISGCDMSSYGIAD